MAGKVTNLLSNFFKNDLIASATRNIFGSSRCSSKFRLVKVGRIA